MANGKLWVDSRNGYVPRRLPPGDGIEFTIAAERIAEATGHNRVFDSGRYRHLFLDSDPYKCPCCLSPMVADMLHGNLPHRRTRGHLHPRTGWPRDNPRPWIWQCSRCNTNQSGRTLWEWAVYLEQHGDHRAARVADLALSLIQHKEIP